MRKLGLAALGLSLLALAGTGPARAQSPASDFPTKPITILVGYAAGGNIDVTARTVGQAMSKVLGQPIVIDNRPGAAGLIAQTAVAKARPDGYTLVLSGTTGFVLAPRLVGTPPYTVDDFVGIGSTSETPLVLEVPANSRFKTFAEFAAYAKANPEALRIGHTGNGTTNHIAILRLQQMLGTKFTPVPYKGSAPAITDLLGSNIDAIIDQIPSSIGQLRSGAFKPLAVTSLKRAADLPDTPTLDELGIKGFEVVTGSGLTAPARTPPATVKILGDALQKVLDDPEVQARLRGLGTEGRKMTPAQYDALLRKEDAAAAAMIKDGLLKAE